MEMDHKVGIDWGGGGGQGLREQQGEIGTAIIEQQLKRQF